LQNQRKNQSIQAARSGAVGVVAGLMAICAILICAGFVLENWRLKARFLAYAKAAGKKLIFNYQFTIYNINYLKI